MNHLRSGAEEEILVLAPTFNDSALAVDVLKSAGLQAVAFETLEDLCQRLSQDCGSVVISEEALTIDETERFKAILEAQPTWSDLPIILLTGADVIAATEVFTKAGNISLLERPFSRLTLIRSVEVALRARRKQYEVRELLEQQAQATLKRDEFFATLSHELRTPLNVILGWLEILASGNLKGTSFKEAIETLERNAKLQKGLIDDLIDISRIVTGKMQVERLPLSLADVVRSVTHSFVPRAKEKGVHLEFNEPSDQFLVHGDEQRLSQVVANLVTNAIKFTPPGGSISTEIRATSDSVFEVNVSDTGQGVDPAFLPLMFDRLKQEDMSTTRAHAGLGLGLAIASHIVQEHGGTIHAQSDGRGRGLSVTFRLPAIDKEKVASVVAVQNPAPTPSLRGVRVLVVDDSPDILKLINLWLGGAEADLRLTTSAAGALDLLGGFDPHVLLSDIGMPEMDGYQLIAKIRSMPQGRMKNLRAVALTAYARDEEQTRALNAGFQMHISKPISRHQLVSAVASLAQQAI
jgi:signal transduction histidine kinase